MTDRNKRMLLIVDPQIDFITGTLPVPGAEKAMDALARYVGEHGEEYGRIIVTCDRHGLRHSSFKEFGGLWPVHCVESSVGAAVWPPLMQALTAHSLRVTFLYKGEDLYKEEYSIFLSESGRSAMEGFINDEGITEVDICGLAGDVCVSRTLDDAIEAYPDVNYRVLEGFTASLDGGADIAAKVGMLRNHLS